ncbi:phosphodiester glycosidase family protein [Parasegetibacter sp. NRK P23]|uniref:phosphodiester glycosidase family protein n=1 Tax=Parasegetibacter sp. NRK P23 TaxID=2942999 RepID=UPI0020443AD7|nr:phosphodiester glycosidase family protein [Parasegetibacter sp. NRK P23]MCM5530655.1 phosphodiester glycosidase family protein [Parasegetibacter sp. NRK P23]
MQPIKFLKAVTGLFFLAQTGMAQLKWTNVNEQFGSLPQGVNVYYTAGALDGKPNVAYYFEVPLKDKKRLFVADTTLSRRLTPQQFYEKNGKPLLVVNTTFFSFQTNQNLNTVVRNGEMVSFNLHSTGGKGKDTLLYHHTTGSAIGISRKRKADVAWLYTDSAAKYPVAFEKGPEYRKDSFQYVSKYTFAPTLHHTPTLKRRNGIVESWKVQTAVGGGPVLVQDGKVRITNNEEMKFAGKALYDKHPRTAMGYTEDGRLIVLVVQGRMPGVAEGADLQQMAKMLIDIGCTEALNLDGGGSSCMLVNGKETIRPSDKEGQRPVPAVFIVK